MTRWWVVMTDNPHWDRRWWLDVTEFPYAVKRASRWDDITLTAWPLEALL